MKRLILLLAAASVPLVAAACEPPAGSRPCTNVIGGGGFYDGSTVLFSMDLEAPPCNDVTYRLIVNEGESNSLRLAQASYTGTSTNPRVDFAAAVTDDDPTICVWARTIAEDGTSLDRAPDTGCLPLTVGEDPPGRRFS